MKQDIAERWVNELESGKYKQGKSRLCNVTGEGDKEYCCLGVLADMCFNEFGKQPEEVTDSVGVHCLDYGSRGNISFLSPEVREWAGMKSCGGTYDELNNHALYHDNDNGKTFPEIAAIIREQVENL